MAGTFSVRLVVLRGLLAGVLFGGIYGWLRENVWVGLIMGAVFGLVMALVLRRQWGSTAFRGLDREQRRAVRRALRRGEAVDDPHLATPLLEAADAVIATPFPVRTYRAVYALVGVPGIVVLALGLPEDGWSAVLVGVPLIAMSLLALFVVLPVVQRQRERAARSAERTHAHAR